MAITFFMLAGEASGDQHASRLIEALKKQEPSARFVGMGGPKMAAAGLEVAKDLDGMQVVGFWEVAKKYGFFRDVFYKLLDRLKQERPDALICVDYPGFNLRFAKEVRKLGIPVLYYIVPQVWAWKPNRPKAMAQIVDRAFCVFEFEPPFFEKFGLKTEFVGHPLVDQPRPESVVFPEARKRVCLLPGSRQSEVGSHYNVMWSAFCEIWRKDRRIVGLISNHALNSELSNFIYLLGCLDGTADATLGKLEREQNVEAFNQLFKNMLPGFVSTQTIGVLERFEKLKSFSHSALLPSLADFSVVKSGTSTLEAGLAGNPMCVVYKGGFISATIARMLVNIPVVSLVNIVLGRYAVPEILQGDMNPQRIAQEIERGLNDEKYREQQKAALAELPKKLGGPGASERAARGMLNFLRGK